MPSACLESPDIDPKPSHPSVGKYQQQVQQQAHLQALQQHAAFAAVGAAASALADTAAGAAPGTAAGAVTDATAGAAAITAPGAVAGTTAKQQ